MRVISATNTSHIIRCNFANVIKQIGSWLGCIHRIKDAHCDTRGCQKREKCTSTVSPLNATQASLCLLASWCTLTRNQLLLLNSKSIGMTVKYRLNFYPSVYGPNTKHAGQYKTEGAKWGLVIYRADQEDEVSTWPWIVLEKNSWRFGRTWKSFGNTLLQLMFPQHFSSPNLPLVFLYLTNKEAQAVYYTERNVENTSRRRVFSTFLKCSQMSGDRKSVV